MMDVAADCLLGKLIGKSDDELKKIREDWGKKITKVAGYKRISTWTSGGDDEHEQSGLAAFNNLPHYCALAGQLQPRDTVFFDYLEVLGSADVWRAGHAGHAERTKAVICYALEARRAFREVDQSGARYCLLKEQMKEGCSCDEYASNHYFRVVNVYLKAQCNFYAAYKVFGNVLAKLGEQKVIMKEIQQRDMSTLSPFAGVNVPKRISRHRRG